MNALITILFYINQFMMVSSYINPITEDFTVVSTCSFILQKLFFYASYILYYEQAHKPHNKDIKQLEVTLRMSILSWSSVGAAEWRSPSREPMSSSLPLARTSCCTTPASTQYNSNIIYQYSACCHLLFTLFYSY